MVYKLTILLLWKTNQKTNQIRLNSFIKKINYDYFYGQILNNMNT